MRQLIIKTGSSAPLLLAALAAAVAGCGGVTAPDLPREADIGDVVLRARLELMDGNARALKVIASAENRRDSTVSLRVMSPGCMVWVRALGGRAPQGVYIWPIGTFGCPYEDTIIEIGAGERLVLPDQPVVDLVEALESLDVFAFGTYRITAVIRVNLSAVRFLGEWVEVFAGEVTMLRGRE